MAHSKKKKFNHKASKGELIVLYTKPFTKQLPALTATNDARYIPSGKPTATKDCTHEYCLAERTRAFMDSDDNPKPVGLPWASGNLKYLPGHKKIVFPLRKKTKATATKKPKKSATPSEETEPDDKITKPETCGVIDEILYAYKVFVLAGMIISEAEKLTGNAEEEEEEEDSDDSDNDDS